MNSNPSFSQGLRLFPNTTLCDCEVHCHHRNPEINRSTRVNHRRDEEVHYGRRISWNTRGHGHPYVRPNININTGQPNDSNRGAAQHTPEAEPNANPAEPPTNNRAHSTPPPGPHVECDLRALRSFEVLEAELDLRQLLCITPLHRPLYFRHPPNANGHFDVQEAKTTRPPNTGVYSLTNHKNNRILIENEERLYQFLDFVVHLPTCRRQIQIMDRIHQGIEEAIIEKQLHWEEQRLSVDMGRVVVYNSKSSFLRETVHVFDEGTDKNFARLPRWPPTVVAAMVISAMMNHFFHVSRQAGIVLLAGIQDILNALPGQISYPNLIPRDPRTIVNALNLDPVAIRYISCVQCHALKKLSEIPLQDRSTTLCDDGTSSTEPCGAPLFKMVTKIGGSDSWRPRRVVLLQSLKDWIGRLLSRPGIEDTLTSYPYHIINDSKPGEVMSDIWGSPVILKLKDSDGQPFFKYHKDDEEIRLLFGLAGDGYNPFRNLIAKQNVKSLGFWITLLNFPPNQRYQFNNVFYLGSLPPDDPPVERYHPIISVIRDMLKEFWDPGVYFTRTSKYPNGRPAKGMLAPSASDMPAARAIYGFTSQTSKFFCMNCPMTYDNIEDVDLEHWGRRDFEAHKKHAFEWKEAQTAREKEKLATKHGIRFTPLLELSYFGPHHFEAVEPMHIEMNLIEHHCRVLLRIDENHNGGDGSGPRMERPAISKKNWPSLQNHLRELLAVFKNCFRDEDAVDKILEEPCATYRNLWYLCSAFDLRLAGNAKQRRLFIRRIIQKMMSQRPEDLESLFVPHAEEPPVSLANVFEEAEIRLRERFQAHGPNFSATEVEDCVGVLGHIYRGNKEKSITQNRPAFINLCHIMQVNDRQGVPYSLSTKDTRAQMYDALQAHQAIQDDLAGIKRNQVGTGDVLGKDVMDAVRYDMDKTIMPSWVAAVPSNWGTAARGKLTESQWKVVFTIHIPITLIWRWRNDTDRLKAILHNLLFLVTSIEIMNLKETNPHMAEAYKVIYKKYVEGILDLFKEDTITPIVHVAGHVGDNLQDFGPSHSRGAQFYERFIHLLQQTKTNRKSGEMEETFLRSQAHAANLMSLIEGHEEIRSQAAEAVKAIQKDTQRNELATLYNLNINLPPGHTYQLGPLSNEENQLLKTHLAEKYNIMDDDAPVRFLVHELEEIRMDTLRYTRMGVSLLDCDARVCVIVKGQKEMGIIQNIFRIANNIPGRSGWDTYLIVQLFTRPTQTSVAEDPYATWQQMLSQALTVDLDVIGRLYPPMDANPCRVIIEPKNIQSHIICADIADLVYIRPTSRLLRASGFDSDFESERSEEP